MVMIVIDYDVKRHKEIVDACVRALRLGKVVAYPTDTSYGLACDTLNHQAVLKFYRIKERTFKKKVHLVVPSVAYAKKLVVWNSKLTKLARVFWPGPLTFADLPFLPDALKLVPDLKNFGAGTGTIGLRMPNNDVALDLVRGLGRPITATSANPSAHLSGGYDSYSGEDVYEQFSKQKYKPDIIINAGKLKKTKPSTLVRVDVDGFEVLRKGPVSEKEIREVIGL